MRKTFIIGLGVFAASLSACSEKSQDHVEQAGDAVGNDLERGINNADDKLAVGADKVGSAIDKAGHDISAAASDAGDEVKTGTKDARKDVGSTLEKAGRDIKD